MVEKCNQDCKNCKIKNVFTNDLVADREYLAQMGCIYALQDLEQEQEREAELEDQWLEGYTNGEYDGPDYDKFEDEDRYDYWDPDDDWSDMDD